MLLPGGFEHASRREAHQRRQVGLSARRAADRVASRLRSAAARAAAACAAAARARGARRTSASSGGDAAARSASARAACSSTQRGDEVLLAQPRVVQRRDDHDAHRRLPAAAGSSAGVASRPRRTRSPSRISASVSRSSDSARKRTRRAAAGGQRDLGQVAPAQRADQPQRQRARRRAGEHHACEQPRPFRPRHRRGDRLEEGERHGAPQHGGEHRLVAAVRAAARARGGLSPAGEQPAGTARPRRPPRARPRRATRAVSRGARRTAARAGRRARPGR